MNRMTSQLNLLVPVRLFACAVVAASTLTLLSACSSTADVSQRATPAPKPAHTLSGPSPVIDAHTVEIIVAPPHEGWQLGRISWIAAGGDGLIYLLHRGDQADPVVVIDAQGKVVRSWGKGLFTLPHSVRLDAQGSVWTTDSTTSSVTKFSPEGTKLMQIRVGGQPSDCVQNAERRGFCGTTDVAWGPEGQVFVADGYGNARIVEYTDQGQKVREWGSAGSGPGQFHLPHSIAVDRQGLLCR